MSNAPQDIAVQLREVAKGISTRTTPNAKLPDWFLREHAVDGGFAWVRLLKTAADELDRARLLASDLDQMKQLNGRLLRRLSGD